MSLDATAAAKNPSTEGGDGEAVIRKSLANPAASPAITPLPRMQVGILAGTNFINSIAYMITLPIAPFIVLSFFPGLSETEIGFKSGALEGMFHVGSFFGAGFWGWAADRYGRKPSLLVGLGGTAVLSVAFGLSSSYAVALFVKFLWGLINGNVGVAKTVLSEISDDTNAPRAFSFIGVATGFGRLVGPAIGGLLAQPAVKYPGTFAADGLFGRHPFLLPCLVCGIITAICFALGAVFLEETGPQRRKAPSSAAKPASSADGAAGRQAANGLPAIDEEAGTAEKAEQREETGIELVAAELAVVDDSHSERRAEQTGSSRVTPSTSTSSKQIAASANRKSAGKGVSAAAAVDEAASAASKAGGSSAAFDDDPARTPASASSGDGARAVHVASPSGTDASSRETRSGIDGATVAFAAAAGAAGDDDDGESEKPALLGGQSKRGRCGDRCAYWHTLRRLLADRAVGSTVAVYAGLSVIGLVATEVFPLYVLNDAEHGGFSWGPSDVGLLVSVCGPCLLLWNLLVYHRVVKRLGLVKMARLCIATNAVLMIATPFCSLALKARPPPTPEQLVEIAQAEAAAALAAAAGDGAGAAAAAAAANAAVAKSALEWALLGAVFIGSTLSRVSAFTCVFVFIANSALPEDRSSANAIGQAVASLARAVGPPIATSVFATSVSDANTAAGWPWNYHLSWYLIGATTFAVLAVSYTMPAWIAKKRDAAAPNDSTTALSESKKLTRSFDRKARS